MAKLEDVNAKLNYLEITKALIKEAIENKGQEIEDSDTFREFVNKISNIQTKSRFLETGISTSGNCEIGDTFTFSYMKDKYKLGDFCHIVINKSKLESSDHSHQYTYKYGILEVIDKEIVNESMENVTFEVIYIFQNSFPEFISNTVAEKGLKYRNEVLQREYNWYSYDYSNLDVTADDVILNKKFLGASGVETGNIPNNGTLNYTPSNVIQTIPSGYTTGGTISAMDITTSDDYTRCLTLSKEILGIE